MKLWIITIVILISTSDLSGQSNSSFSIELSYGLLNNYNLGAYQSNANLDIINEENLFTSYYQVNIFYNFSDKQGFRIGLGQLAIGRELILQYTSDIQSVYPTQPCTARLLFGNFSVGYYYKIYINQSLSISASPDISLNLNLLKHKTCYIPPRQYTGQYGLKLGLEKRIFNAFSIQAKYVLFKSWNNILFDFTPLSTYNTLSQGIEFSITHDLLPIQQQTSSNFLH